MLMGEDKSPRKPNRKRVTVSKIVLAIDFDGNPTAKDVQNAVRRAFPAASSDVFEVGFKGTAKDVSFYVAPSPESLPIADIRAWAADNGYNLGARGRVAREVVLAYEAAQSKPRKGKK